jgi:hypothetical protein
MAAALPVFWHLQQAERKPLREDNFPDYFAGSGKTASWPPSGR